MSLGSGDILRLFILNVEIYLIMWRFIYKQIQNASKE